MKTNELSVIFSDHKYNWPELKEKLKEVMLQAFQGGIQSVYRIPAQDRWLITLAALNGFVRLKTIFSLSESVSKDESSYLLQQVKACCHKDNQNDSICLAIATSGSQAEPKIALISQNNILQHCESFNKIIPLVRQSIWLNCLPMNHIAGMMILYRCWFNQSTMLLHEAFEVEKIWRDFHRYAVTHISLVPIMLARLLDYCQDAAPPESLSYVIVGGDKLSDSLYQRAIDAGWPIWISYGMTETTSTLALGRKPNRLTPLDGFELSESEQGTLKVKGKAVISAYANNEGLSLSSAWFETSDRVKIEHNTIQVLGRNDHMIISGGKNIAPEFIEQQLSLAPGITDIAIAQYHSDTDNEWGDTIAAVVCGDVETLKPWLKQNIESTYRPRYFVHIDRIPRNSMGKIDRKAVYRLINKS